jgi:hypothetical protein
MSDQRRGKIARLPRSIRDELNVRLDDGQDADQVLPWLNELPEVRDVLKQHFNGAPISPQNLSGWRQGGFNEWLLFHQFLESAERMTDYAEDLNERLGPDCPDTVPRKLADSMLTHLSARMAAFIAGWDGAATSPEMEALLKLTQFVIKLQRAICQTERHDSDLRGRSRFQPSPQERLREAGATLSEYHEWMGLKKPVEPGTSKEDRELPRKRAINRAASHQSQSKPVKVDKGSKANRAAPPKSTQPPVVENVPSANVTHAASSSLKASQSTFPVPARETEMTP